MTALFLGIDIGTSGVRSAVVREDGEVLCSARATLPETGPRQDAETWWEAVTRCLSAQVATLGDGGHDPRAIRAAAIDGTSGSMVLVGADVVPVTPALMYSSGGFDAEAATIALHAPAGHISRGASSALARLLRLQSLAPRGAAAMCHQADFILARLGGRSGATDENNALKLGYDPETGSWPGWLAAAGVATSLLPEVFDVGALVGRIAPDIARELGLSENLCLRAGTTDSIAAFLASGATVPGDAVTSLGTTLAIKLLSETRIDDSARGIYSHRIGGRWLAGGASNTGGGVLRQYFGLEEIAALESRLRPDRDTGLDYYPLPAPGERFPVNDPDLRPRLEPRPPDDALFLQGILEGIARIERDGYRALRELGAPEPTRILTAGGGARNRAWTRIRERISGYQIAVAGDTEASVGMARLCLLKSREPG